MRPALALALARPLALALWAASLSPPALAHDGVRHPIPDAAAALAAETGPAPPFPIEIRPRFSLTDHTGRAVTEADFAGRPMVVFFGYANCESICSVALPTIGAALDLLGPRASGIAPVMITVDPARDTPAALSESLPRHHPSLIGLTGDEAALAAVRAVFQVEAAQVAATPEGAPVYAHGSFIYLVGRDGVVKAVLPPVLSPGRIAALMLKHL